MSRKKKVLELNIDIHRKIKRAPYAEIPMRLAEVLLRTAADWAIHGDLEAAQWFFDELTLLDRLEKTGQYHSAKTRKEFDRYKGMPCVICGRPSDTIDHIIPISRGGTNDPSNLQPMCHWCNSTKGTKLD
jgi:hypothetical protein